MNGGTPKSNHPFLIGIFPHKNHPAIGEPLLTQAGASRHGQSAAAETAPSLGRLWAGQVQYQMVMVASMDGIWMDNMSKQLFYCIWYIYIYIPYIYIYTIYIYIYHIYIYTCIYIYTYIHVCILNGLKPWCRRPLFLEKQPLRSVRGKC